MDYHGALAACVLLLLILFIWYHEHYEVSESHESFDVSPSARHARAVQIYDWMQKNPNPTYTQYRKDLPSDILEYEDIMALKKNGLMSVSSIEMALNN